MNTVSETIATKIEQIELSKFRIESLMNTVLSMQHELDTNYLSELEQCRALLGINSLVCAMDNELKQLGRKLVK